MLFLVLNTVSYAADKSPISVHILDTQTGMSPVGVNVKLEKLVDEEWIYINEATTDEMGRISNLFVNDKAFESGYYRVLFETGEWFEKQNQDTFFPKIPVIFNVLDAKQHYHISLLLSAYGYSTYRGN